METIDSMENPRVPTVFQAVCYSDSSLCLGGTDKLQEASVQIGICGHMFPQPQPVSLVGLSLWSSLQGQKLLYQDRWGVSLGRHDSGGEMNSAPKKELSSHPAAFGG